MARAARLVLAVAAAALLGACSTTVSGTGQAAAPAPRSTSPAAPNPGAEQLAARLMDPPAGSHPWSSDWARMRTPTVRQFVVWDYGSLYVEQQISLLDAEGLRYIAHETWLAPDGDQADMLLMQFADAAGAQSRYLYATVARRSAAGMRTFHAPHEPRVVGFYRPKLDRLGNVVAIMYAQVHQYVVEEFYYSPARIRTADAIAWMRTQLARLH